MTPAQKQICSYNGCDLTGDELESPHTVGTDIFCNECYDNWFSENSFECPLCLEREVHDEESEYFIVFDPDVDVPGIYKVVSYPFYSQPLIGEGMLYKHAVSRVGFAPVGPSDNSPCAFICKDCMAKKIDRVKP